MNLEKIKKFSLNPWVVIGSLIIGFGLGSAFPAFSLQLGFVGELYVDLMKMIVLPFMISAIIFSLQRMFKDGGSQSIMARLVGVFIVFSLTTVILSTVMMLVAQPGSNVSQETMQTFGKIVGNDASANNLVMDVHGVDAPKKELTVGEVLFTLVPSNIFSALANGETLKALVFAILFGLAIGNVPSRVSDPLTHSLETVYHSCQTLTRWMNIPIPLILISMGASQLAKTGTGPLLAMTNFVLLMLLLSFVVIFLSVLVVWKRSGLSLSVVVDALKEQFILAVATRNSATCMPSMVDALADRLGFPRDRVELLVPLTVSLLRIGPMLYYAAATLFIAQLYGRSLTPVELTLVVSVSILAGFASAGMSGLVTISLTGMACSYLGLPFEAAFILFAAVDPVCDMLRTMINVMGNSAAVSIICPMNREPA